MSENREFFNHSFYESDKKMAAHALTQLKEDLSHALITGPARTMLQSWHDELSKI